MFKSRHKGIAPPALPVLPEPLALEGHHFRVTCFDYVEKETPNKLKSCVFAKTKSCTALQWQNMHRLTILDLIIQEFRIQMHGNVSKQRKRPIHLLQIKKLRGFTHYKFARVCALLGQRILSPTLNMGNHLSHAWNLTTFIYQVLSTPPWRETCDWNF